MYSYANAKQEAGHRIEQWGSKDSILHKSVCDPNIGVTLWQKVIQAQQPKLSPLLEELSTVDCVGVSILRRTWETAFLVLLRNSNNKIPSASFDNPTPWVGGATGMRTGVVQIPYIREIGHKYDVDDSNKAFDFGV
jgi:hypothetical protein